jgi:hypothetical protein
LPAHSFRQKFIELAEDVFRELGFPPPAMTHEESLPLAMELEIETMQFELLHSSTDQPDHILVSCKLGPLPDEGITVGLRRLLQANLVLARTHEACYGIEPETKNVHCMFPQVLAQANAVNLLASMREIATGSAHWKDEFFSVQAIHTNNDITHYKTLA